MRYDYFLLHAIEGNSFSKVISEKHRCGSKSVAKQLRNYPTPSPPLTNSNPNLLTVDCCWVRGGVGNLSKRAPFPCPYLRFFLTRAPTEKREKIYCTVRCRTFRSFYV